MISTIPYGRNKPRNPTWGIIPPLGSPTERGVIGNRVIIMNPESPYYESWGIVKGVDGIGRYTVAIANARGECPTFTGNELHFDKLVIPR